VLAAILVFAVRPLPERATLEHPSRITTGKSSSHLALPGLALEVQPESAVVVGAETPQGLLIVLDGGSITCQVAPRQRDAPLIVQAGGVRVQVVGTRFSVTRLGESARVQVYEGVVEVRSQGHSLRVGAGEEWPARATPPTSPKAAAADAERRPKAADESDESTRNAKPAAAARTKGRSNTSAPTTREPSATTTEQATTEASSHRSSQEVFEQATALENSDPVKASQLYRTLESGSDSWAQNALYARGRLAASRGNSGEARRLLELYLQRFPRGGNAEDARAVLRRLR
jgi:hypothetical protein